MSYSPSNPPSAIDLARARLGDLGTPPILADWIYTANLGAYSENEALARLAEAIGTYYLPSEGTSLTLGDQTFKSGGRSKYYFELAKSLRENVPIDATDTSFSGGATDCLAPPCPNVLDGPYDPCCNPLGWPYGDVRCLP